jgi:hypothetical protein
LEIAKELAKPDVSNDLEKMDKFLFQSNDIPTGIDTNITNFQLEHINKNGFNVRISFVYNKYTRYELKCVYTEISICKNNSIQIKIGESAFIFSISEDLIFTVA